MMPDSGVNVPEQLVHLSTVDLVIIAFYFVLVLAIGFYLRGVPRPAKTSSWPAAR